MVRLQYFLDGLEGRHLRLIEVSDGLLDFVTEAILLHHFHWYRHRFDLPLGQDVGIDHSSLHAFCCHSLVAFGPTLVADELVRVFWNLLVREPDVLGSQQSFGTGLLGAIITSQL